MDGIFEDWPWSEANNYVDPASDLLDDLTFQQSSKSYHFEQQSFDWNEDLFAELDDFILFPETACEEYESFDKPSLSSHYDGETASQSSPSSSLPSSPAVSLADGPSKASAEEEQHVVVANLDNERPHRRRRTNTVFPCTLCKRVCFTSVEARLISPHTSGSVFFCLLTLVVDDITLDMSSLSSAWNSRPSLCSLKPSLPLDHSNRLQQRFRLPRRNRDVAKHSQQRMSSNGIGKAFTIASQQSGQRNGSSVQSSDAKLLRGSGRGETICWST
jgi:hypothetical protein